MAFSKSLEEVIEAALADGVITEKERAVLHKKAQQEGVDPDEIDVVIDGRLQQMQNEVDKAKQKVRKCPSCGEIIPAMTAVCPSCGQVIDTSNPDNKALQKYMNKLEDALVKLKEDGAKNFNHKVRAELEGMIRQGKAMYGDNKKIAYLISEVEASIEEFEKSHKKAKITKYAIIAVITLCIMGWKLSGVYSEHAKIEKITTQAQHQKDSLCALIDQLEIPTKENYKDVEAKLLRLSWNDIMCDIEDEEKREQVISAIWDKRHEFIEKKKAIASQIKTIYDDIYDCPSYAVNDHIPEALDDACYDN